jgi:tetratricopeptide (TPR) repeat protein
MSDGNSVDFSKLFNIQSPAKLDQEQPVLVVEDQQDMRLIIAHQLKKLQFSKVLQASNGYDALEIMQTTPQISAVICDFEMPVMGGVDLLTELRERVDIDRPPFCISMDRVSKERIMLAVESGADEILVKPFTLADIFPKVQMSWKKFHNPKNPEKVYELAKVALRNKNLDAAEKVYKLLADSADTSARPLVGLARVALGRNDVGKALEYLTLAEQRNKLYVHVFSERGLVYLKMKQFEDALKCFEAAIELSPLNAIRYKSAADVLFLRERYQEAVTLLEKAVKLGLEFKELYHYLSQGYFALKDFAKASRFIKSALALDPENLMYLNQLGICYKQQNMFDDANKVYNQIIKLDQDNVPALYNKAMLCEAKKDIPEAIKLLERAIKKDPEFALAISKLSELKSKLPEAS